MHAKALLPTEKSLGHAQERRRNPRQPTQGVVFFTIKQLDPLEVRGLLEDLSGNGFRAAHDFTGLCPGEQVEFRHDHGTGVAKVIWTRISGSTVESGFLVLEKTSR